MKIINGHCPELEAIFKEKRWRKYSTKVLYRRYSSCYEARAPENKAAFGTKWVVTYRFTAPSGVAKIIGRPRLVDANWVIDERTVQESFLWRFRAAPREHARG